MEISDIPTDGTAKEVIFSNKTGIRWLEFRINAGTGQNVGLGELKVYGTPCIKKYIPAMEPAGIEKLLDKFDLSRAGLEAVKAHYDADINLNPNKWNDAAEDLLIYFRDDPAQCRLNLHASVDRLRKPDWLGNTSLFDPAELPHSEDIIRHIFNESWITGFYQDCKIYLGESIDWFTNLPDSYMWRFHLNTLDQYYLPARTYWYTGDEEYALAIMKDLADWIENNPCPRYDSGAYYYNQEADDRKDSETRPTNHSTFFVAKRLRVFIDILYYLIDSVIFSKEMLIKLLTVLYNHTDFLRHYDGTAYGEIDHYSMNNFAIFEALGMAYVSALFPEFKDSEGWRRSVAGCLSTQININKTPNPYPYNGQVHPDGFTVEECSHYHAQMISQIMDIVHIFGINGYNVSNYFDDKFKERINDMLRAFMKVMFPDGNCDSMGDSGCWDRDFRRVLYGRLAYTESYKSDEADDIKYALSSYTEGMASSETAFALQDSGLYSMRSGWEKDAIFMLLKCGPKGMDSLEHLEKGTGFHCQPDNGTFEIYAGGRVLTPDPGGFTYEYTEGSRRYLYRQTKIHQTLTLDGKDTDYAPSLRLWKTSPDLDTLIVENQSYADLKHRRAVHFVKKQYFVFIDEATGSASGDIDVHFYFAPGDAVYDEHNLTAHTSFESGRNLLVKGYKQSSVLFITEDGWYSPLEGLEMQRPAFAFRIYKNTRASVRFINLIIPYNGTIVPEADVSLVNSPDPGADVVEVKVTVNGETFALGYNVNKGDSWLI